MEWDDPLTGLPVHSEFILVLLFINLYFSIQITVNLLLSTPVLNFPGIQAQDFISENSNYIFFYFPVSIIQIMIDQLFVYVSATFV